MYDCTTLHFETSDEDAGPKALRKVGMSKEHRVDPQAQVGLLTDRVGIPVGGQRVRGQRSRVRRKVACSEWITWVEHAMVT
jgi:hypothetical protein